MRNLTLIPAIIFMIFLLYLTNFFVLGIILACLLAITIDRIIPINSMDSLVKYVVVFLIGLIALILYVLTIFSRLFMIFGPNALAYLHPFTFWSLITIIILRIFTNIVLFPFLSIISRSISSKNMKKVFLIALIIFAVVSIVWQANYRTIPPDYELSSFHNSIADILKEEVTEFRDEELNGGFYLIESIRIVSIRNPILLYTIADICLTNVIGLWWFKNHTLVAIGSGLFVLNYYTETGKRLLNYVVAKYNGYSTYNVTPTRSREFSFISIINGFEAGNITIELHYFNHTHNEGIALNYSSSWRIMGFGLKGGVKIEFSETKKISGSGEIEFVFNKNSAGWRRYYDQERTIIINVFHVVSLDLMTFLEFYKYEIMLAWIIFLVLEYTSILAKIKRRISVMKNHISS